MSETSSTVTEYRGEAEELPARAGEEELWNWLENLASESERVRQQEARFNEFDKYLDTYYGKHWPDTVPSFRPPVVVNELRTLILSEASDLTENNLRLYVQKDPRLGGKDEEVERAIRAVWAREQIDLKLLYAAVWTLIAGTGFIRVQWDPDAFHGMGDVIVDDLDPRYILPDADAIDDKRWAYVMVEQTMDIDEIRRMFPIEGMRVRPEDRWSIRERSRGGNVAEGVMSNQYQGPLSDSGLVGRQYQGYKKARARVLDCFIRDTKTEKVIEPELDPVTQLPRKDENGNPILKEQIVAKYPRGRRIIGANGTILFDGPNPNPGGDFGILRLVLEPALGRFWGTGFVQQTMELQLAADKLASSVAENAIRLNNGMVVATTNTGLDWESFTGMPGQIVTINQGSQFDIKYPNPMPADMIQAPWRMLDMQRRILGFPEARTGQAGAGNTSADLTETEISQAQGPTRLRGRMLYFMVQRLVEMIFSRMANGYLTERVIPAVEGESFKPVVWKPLERPEDYNVFVNPASFQVMSRTMLRRLGMALYKLQAIDRQSLLEIINWPDSAEVSDRLAKQQQMMEYAKWKAKMERKR